MVDLTIKTNNRARNMLYWHELSDKEKSEFDYLDTEERQSDAMFLRYRGWAYDLAEFMRVPPGMFPGKWQSYHSDSYFSGILVKYVNDGESVIAATYFS